MSEPLGTVLPVYFVADESGSMTPNIPALNDGLLNLLDSLHSQPFAAAKVRFAVVGFADDAISYLEPTDLRSIDVMPELVARGGTSYKAVFDCLSQIIPDDVNSLKSQGYLVNRPAVFFLSDGVPLDHPEWEEARDYLLSLPQHPNILAFGIGEADPEIVKKVATRPQFAFQADSEMDTGTAIAEFINTLTQSVVSSGQALASGSGQLEFEKPEGFISLDVETM